MRDRYYEDTFEELNKFLNRLAKRIYIESMYVNLQGMFSKSYRFTFPKSHMFTNLSNCYSHMFEKENPWYDYLMWEWKDED